MAMNLSLCKIIMLFILFIIFGYFPNSIQSFQYSCFRKIQLPSTEMGPESLAFNSLGEGPYTGVSDGRVIKYEALTATFLNFAVTSPRRTAKLCDGTTDINLGPTCGLPLGLGFNSVGELYINDPFNGLTVVGPNGGLATILATSAEGVPFKFLVGLDVDPITGLVYFTDASSVFDPRNATQSIESGDSTGRLLRYDPITRQVTVLLRGLAGAVGVAVSKDGTFVLVSEFIRKRIQKYWLIGSKANTSEVLITFDGNPNKIKRNQCGYFWVAVNNQKQQQPTPVVAPIGVKIDGRGVVQQTVDLSAQYNQRITVVQEQLSSLYVGALNVTFIGLFSSEILNKCQCS